jgi:putative ABC transport system permease protein
MHSLTTVLVRTHLDPAALMPAVKAAVYGAGNGQPIYDVRTMQQAVASSINTHSFPMVLLGAFAVLALVLASVGTYGLVANFVQHRMQEIGIRMALGAQRVEVFRMVIWQGLRMALTGIVMGAVGAFILARGLSSFSHLLYGVSTGDPITFLGVSIVLMSVAFAGVLHSCTSCNANRSDYCIASRIVHPRTSSGSPNASGFHGIRAQSGR